jgi:hypothetical protein
MRLDLPQKLLHLFICSKNAIVLPGHSTSMGFLIVSLEPIANIPVASLSAKQASIYSKLTSGVLKNSALLGVSYTYNKE